jgi:hypothetical protein
MIYIYLQNLQYLTAYTISSKNDSTHIGVDFNNPHFCQLLLAKILFSINEQNFTQNLQ